MFSPSVLPRPSERVRKSWGELKGALWLFLLLLFSSLAMGLGSRQGRALSLEVAVVSFDAAIIVLFALWQRADVARLLSFQKPSAGALGRTVAAAVVFVAGAQIYFSAVGALGVPFVSLTKDYVDAQWPVWAILGMVALLPGVFEEIAFRGVIQSVLCRVLSSRRDALLVQGALFSVLHLSPVVFPSHFFMGLVFGWLREKNANLYGGMLLHSAWNAYVAWSELA